MRRLALPAVLLALAAGCADDDGGVVEPAAEARIVFASLRDGDFEIYSMRPDGSDVRQLTRNEPSGRVEADDADPAWSPDGRMIAFTSTRDHEGDGIEAQEIYVMGADGGDQRRLTENTVADVAPDWTPDGRVVFLSCKEGLARCALKAVDPEGGEPETLWETEGVAEFPALAPDGERVAVTTFDPRSSVLQPRIEIVRLADAEVEETIRDGGAAAWSPDGKRLAFASDRDGNGRCLFHDCTGFKTELYVADEAGGTQRRLTATDKQEGDPAWSPGGKRLAFARITDEKDDYELFVMNDDGSCVTRLTDNGEWDWMPDWYAPAKTADDAVTC